MNGTTLNRYIAGRVLRGIGLAFLIVTAIITLVDFVEGSRNLGADVDISPMQLLTLTLFKVPKLIEQNAPTKDILGICLGHQAIGEAFGAKLKNLSKVFHGIKTPISIIEKDVLFKKMDTTIEVGRYHSWVIDKATMPAELDVLAYDEDGEIQALSHKKYHVKGLQFHPESIMTKDGKQILANFLASSNKN